MPQRRQGRRSVRHDSSVLPLPRNQYMRNGDSGYSPNASMRGICLRTLQFGKSRTIWRLNS
jgi:hypothetical protein